jgi:hypothetical protein
VSAVPEKTTEFSYFNKDAQGVHKTNMKNEQFYIRAIHKRSILNRTREICKILEEVAVKYLVTATKV